MRGKVSVVLVNWNSLEFLPRCIASVLGQTYGALEFLFIDNASQDGSTDWLKAQHPDVEAVVMERNLGFAAAHNLAIARTDGEFYMPLNPDVVLAPDYVERLVECLRSDVTIGSVTGKLLRISPRGTLMPIIDSTGHVMSAMRMGANRGEGEFDEGQWDEAREVFGVSGTAPLYRRSMLDSIRLGDEYYDASYFAYWEDLDLDWRAQHAGWASRFEPTAVAHHFRQGNRQFSPEVLGWSFRNRYLTMLKNERLVSVKRDLPYLFVQEFTSWLRMPFHRNGHAQLRALPSLIRRIPEGLRKRRQIFRTETTPRDIVFPRPEGRRWRRMRRRTLQKLAWVTVAAVLIFLALRAPSTG